MKLERFIMILAGASALMLSCSRETLDEVTAGPAPATFSGTVEETTAKADLKYDDESGYEVLWDQGDQVAICGSNGKYGIYEALSSGSATTFEKVSGGDDLTAGFTAYYPASSYKDGVYSLPYEQTYSDSEIKVADFPLVAYSSTHTLSFKNMCAVLKINVKAPYDMSVYDILVDGCGFGLSGAVKDLVFDEETGAPSYSVEGTRGVRLFCGEEGVEIKSGEVRTFFVAVPPVDNKKVKISVRTTAQLSQTLSATVTLHRAKVKNASVQCTELVYDYCYGHTNCYVSYGDTKSSVTIDITPYKIDAEYMRAGVATHAPAVKKAAVLWNNDGEIINGEPVLAGNSVTVNMNESNYGNACVAIYDEDDNVLWSYVIWKPEISPFENLLVYNEMETDRVHYQVMPMFIGATNTVKAEGGVIPDYNEALVKKSYGLYYQGGRPNAFPRYDATLSGCFSVVKDTEYSDLRDNSGIFGVPVMVKMLRANPTVFYCASAKTSGDIYGNLAKQYLWGASDATAYDPCPAGYKISTTHIFECCFCADNVRATQGDGNYAVNPDGTARVGSDGGFYLYYQYIPSYLQATAMWDNFRKGKMDFYPRQNTRNGTTGKVDGTPSNLYIWCAGPGNNYFGQCGQLGCGNKEGTLVGTNCSRINNLATGNGQPVRCVKVPEL